MKYRIVKLNNGYFSIQRRFNFFPFWEFSDSSKLYDTAELAKESLIDPLEVKEVIEVVKTRSL